LASVERARSRRLLAPPISAFFFKRFSLDSRARISNRDARTFNICTQRFQLWSSRLRWKHIAGGLSLLALIRGDAWRAWYLDSLFGTSVPKPRATKDHPLATKEYDSDASA
jgi:hypothetical protein